MLQLLVAAKQHDLSDILFYFGGVILVWYVIIEFDESKKYKGWPSIMTNMTWVLLGLS